MGKKDWNQGVRRVSNHHSKLKSHGQRGKMLLVPVSSLCWHFPNTTAFFYPVGTKEQHHQSWKETKKMKNIISLACSIHSFIPRVIPRESKPHIQKLALHTELSLWIFCFLLLPWRMAQYLFCSAVKRKTGTLPSQAKVKELEGQGGIILLC